jgi:uncharacterized membrane protein
MEVTSMCKGNAEHRRKRQQGWFALGATAWSIALTVAIPPSAFGQCLYQPTVINGPACPFVGQAALIPTGMNNHGEVVGFWEHCDTPATEAFFWSESTGLITLPRPDGVGGARADDVNDNRLVVGRHSITGVGTRGFVYDINNPNAGFTYLEPKVPDVNGNSSLSAINNAGLAVGSRSFLSAPAPYNAVVWDTHTGEVLDLGVMGIGPNSAAVGVSENGFIVGWTGSSSPALGFFRDQTGAVAIVPPFPGAQTSSTANVANDGIVVGTGVVYSVPTSRAYVWHTKEDEPITIDPLIGYTSTQGVDRNNVGQTLLRSSAGASNIVGGLWQHGEHQALSDLAQAPGLLLGRPKAINDSGMILVEANIETPSGHRVTVVLTPGDRPLADLNADCAVDVDDLLLMLSVWGPCGDGFCYADLNGDGAVDVLDLLILLDNWGMGGREAPRK